MAGMDEVAFGSQTVAEISGRNGVTRAQPWRVWTVSMLQNGVKYQVLNWILTSSRYLSSIIYYYIIRAQSWRVWTVSMLQNGVKYQVLNWILTSSRYLSSIIYYYIIRAQSWRVWTVSMLQNGVKYQVRDQATSTYKNSNIFWDMYIYRCKCQI